MNKFKLRRGSTAYIETIRLNSIQKLSNILIYGNSYQAGTPTYKSPKEITCVGDKSPNLFNVFNAVQQSNYVDRVKLNTDGSLTIYQPTGSSVSDYTTLQQFAPSLEVGKTYVLNFKTTGTITASNQIWILNSKEAWVRGTSRTIIDTDLTSPIFWYGDGEGQTITISEIQITEGTETKEYKPYGYNIPLIINNKTYNIYLNEPLRKVLDYCDYIDITNKKVVRNICQELITTASAMSSNSGKYSQFLCDISNKPLLIYPDETQQTRINVLGPCMSNKFRLSPVVYRLMPNYENIGSTYITTSESNRFTFTFDDPNINTHSLGTEALGDGAIVHYVLSKPQTETINLNNIPVDDIQSIEVRTSLKPSSIQYEKIII